MKSKMQELRKASGLTQRQCAVHVNISPQYWAQIEINTRHPSTDVASRIATFLQVPVEDMGFMETRKRRRSSTPVCLSVPNDSLEKIDRIRGAKTRQRWIYQAIAEQLDRILATPD